jgi:hypothetical protein
MAGRVDLTNLFRPKFENDTTLDSNIFPKYMFKCTFQFSNIPAENSGQNGSVKSTPANKGKMKNSGPDCCRPYLRVALTVAGLAGFLWQFLDSVSKFRETATSFTTSYDDAAEIEFPPFILCPHGGFSSPADARFNVTRGQLLKGG